MKASQIAGFIASAIFASCPAFVMAAVRDIPNRDLPGEYVETISQPGQVNFIDVKNVARSENGIVSAQVYLVEAKAQDINGKDSPFQAVLIKYDCVAGSMLLDHIDYIDGNFGLIATAVPPPGFKAWLIGDKPDLAVAYGFREVCQSAELTSPRVGSGKPWVGVAASVRSKLSPQ